MVVIVGTELVFGLMQRIYQNLPRNAPTFVVGKKELPQKKIICFKIAASFKML